MAANPRMIGLLLLPAFTHLAMSAIIEPLFIANWLSGRALYRWQVLSLDGQPVKASTGTAVPVDCGVKLDCWIVAVANARPASETATFPWSGVYLLAFCTSSTSAIRMRAASSSIRFMSK